MHICMVAECALEAMSDALRVNDTTGMPGAHAFSDLAIKKCMHAHEPSCIHSTLVFHHHASLPSPARALDPKHKHDRPSSSSNHRRITL